MATSATFTVEVKANGLALTRKQLDDLGFSVKETTSKTKDADKASQDLFDTQNKGIIGTANSTKSFSKLAETIGGSSGVVAAYATLAANTFALTAAFNALKQAAQLDQIFRGLEASGARTGQTLTVAAEHLQEITGYAISAKQALQSTAQVMSGGFSTKDLERLGQVAKDASFALGRDMTDSLDRLTRGVVKLEPELLDELGIMTKINDSNTMYAATLGKSVTSLTNFQKRQGFLNAVVAEATLKFGGLSEAAGNSRVYDQLGATFENLKNSVLGTLNTAIIPFLNIISMSPAALGGAAVIFAGTLSKQLLPGLADLQIKTAAAIEASKLAARAQLDEVKARNDNIAAIQKQIVEQRELVAGQAAGEISSVSKRTPNYNKMVPGIIEGSIPATQGLETLTKSLTYQQNQLSKAMSAGDLGAIENRKEIIHLIEDQITRLNSLIEAETKLAAAEKTAAAENTLAIQAQVIEQANYQKAVLETAALEQSGGAIAAAAQGKVGLAVRGVIGTYQAYREALLAAETAAIEVEAAALAAAAAEQKLGVQAALTQSEYASMIRKGAFTNAEKETLSFSNQLNLLGVTAKTAGRAIATAFLNFIPVIGTAVFAFGLLQEAWEFFQSDSAKATKKAMEELGKIIDDTTNKISAFQKAQESTAAVGLRTAQQLTLQSNAITELRDAYDEAAKARRDFDKAQQSTGISGAFDSAFLSRQQRASYATGLRQDNDATKLLSNSELTGRRFSSTDSALVKGTEVLGKYMDLAPEATKEVLKLYGGLDQISKLPTDAKLRTIGAVIDEVGKKFDSNADLISSLVDSLKNANNALGDFAVAQLPSTPFTAVYKSLDTVAQSITNINRAVTDGKASLTDWVKVLDQAGPNVTNFLTPDQNKTLQTVREMDTIKQSLEAQQKAGNSLNDTDKQRLAHASAFLDSHKQIYASVQDQLRSTLQLFEVAQRNAILNQQQLALLQSIASANQANYAATGAGELARVKNLNDQIKLQQSTLDSQKAILETQLAVNAAKAQEYLTQSGITKDAERANLVEQKRQALAEAAASRAKFNSGRDVRDYYQSQGQLQNADNIQKQIDSFDSYKDQVRQNQLQELAIKSVMTQIATLQNGITTDAQAQAQAAKLDISFMTQRLTSLQSQKAIYQSNYDMAVKIDRLINGTTDNISSAVADLANARNRTNDEIANKYASSIADLENQISQAKADGAKTDADSVDANRTRISQLQDQLDVQKQSMSIEQDQADLTFKLGVYEKALFDTRKDGLEYQQTALSYIQKQVDAQKELSDATQEGIKARLTLDQRRQGLGNSEGFQRGSEIMAAREAYKIAVQQSEIKKASIDAEYALLDAQREIMKEQIADRRNVLADLAKTDNSPALQARIDQLNATLNNLDRGDLTAAREASKRAIDESVRTARTNLQSSLLRDLGDSNGSASRLRGAAFERAQRRAGYGDLANPGSATQVGQIKEVGKVVDDSAKKIADQYAKGTATLDTNIKSIIEILQKIATNTGGGASGYDSSGLSGNVKRAADFLSGTGKLNSTAIAGIIGNLQQESGQDLTQRVSKDGSHLGVSQFGSANQKAFFQEFGKSVKDASVEEELKYVVEQLQKTPGAVDILNGSKTFSEAAKHFEEIFEKSGGSALGARQANAERVGTALTSTRTVSTSGSVATDTAASAASGPEIVVNGKRAANDNPFATAPSKMAVTNVDAGLPNITKTAANVGDATTKLSDNFENLRADASDLMTVLNSMGPEGGPLKAVVSGFSAIGDGITNLSSKISALSDPTASGSSIQKWGDAFVAAAQIALSAISAVDSAIQSSATNQENAIDTQIQAEQNRDGKSAESVAKIDALQKKKDQIAKKAFETDKKLKMASALIATATGVAQALAYGPLGIPLAVAIGALGAAEIAIIAGTQYESSYSPASVTSPSSLTIGTQGNQVDLAKQNSNVGGELGYLRGTPGTGSNASNYNVVNSAYGGSLDRGYGNTAYVVGEKGPEVLTQDTPITISPMNAANGNSPVSANINIHAIDSQGVADVLHGQRGNIISMLREAANANGQTFLEDVDVNVYTRPNISRL